MENDRLSTIYRRWYKLCKQTEYLKISLKQKLQALQVSYKTFRNESLFAKKQQKKKNNLVKKYSALEYFYYTFKGYSWTQAINCIKFLN